MKYKHISPDYKFELLAQHINSRELEFFHYEFDKNNLEAILTTLPDGPYRTEIEGRLNSTIEQMNKVEAIYNALITRIDDQTKYEEAVTALKAKRLAAQEVKA